MVRLHVFYWPRLLHHSRGFHSPQVAAKTRGGSKLALILFDMQGVAILHGLMRGPIPPFSPTSLVWSAGPGYP
jgi:hypothetical protein